MIHVLRQSHKGQVEVIPSNEGHDGPETRVLAVVLTRSRPRSVLQ